MARTSTTDGVPSAGLSAASPVGGNPPFDGETIRERTLAPYRLLHPVLIFQHQVGDGHPHQYLSTRTWKRLFISSAQFLQQYHDNMA